MLLAEILPEPLPRNADGGTPLDEFEGLRVRTGLDKERDGKSAYDWSLLAFVTEWSVHNADSPIRLTRSALRQPDLMLAELLPQPLPVNTLGHTPIDDFEHFCSYTGLSESHSGREAVAWARLFFVSEWLRRHASNRSN
ncbi:hypothetical protein [Paraburkholderia hospita]|uniref:hypothetical protein n=1 Tax=Paraburkholderia hospita TaxID=169430 RepID=UPI000B843331|nr:hypothetical protein [Paraburkholderia hospita]